VSAPPFDDAPPAWDVPAEAYENELAAKAPVVLINRGSKPPSQPDKGAKPRVVFRHAHEIVAEKRETTWLLHKILEAYVLAVVAGPRGTFKSFIVLDWLMRIALQGHTVAILSGEGAGLDRRIDAWMRTHAPDTDLATLSIVVLERPLNLSLIADMEALREAFEALPQKPAVVAVDTFSKFSAGIDENDNSEVAAYLSVLSEHIREAFDATVLLVAHSGHSDAKRPRGASALMANPDAEYIVERLSQEAMTVTVSRERFKDGSALPPLAYEARVVDLGRRDQYGDPVTSLALHSADMPAVRTRPGKNQEKAVGALKEWVRTNASATHISSIDIAAVFKAQGLAKNRRPEVLTYLVNIRALTPSIGGFSIDKAML
jgi:hypothetical protein